MGRELRTKHSISLDPDLVVRVDRYASERRLRSFSAAIEDLVLIGLRFSDDRTFENLVQDAISEKVLAPAISRLLTRHPEILVPRRKGDPAIRSAARG